MLNDGVFCNVNIKKISILIRNKIINLNYFVMKLIQKCILITTYGRMVFAERFPSILFGINLLFIPIKLSNVEAVTRKNEQAKRRENRSGI